VDALAEVPACACYDCGSHVKFNDSIDGDMQIAVFCIQLLAELYTKHRFKIFTVKERDGIW
jgi:hypothetical protein